MFSLTLPRLRACFIMSVMATCCHSLKYNYRRVTWLHFFIPQVATIQKMWNRPLILQFRLWDLLRIVRIKKNLSNIYKNIHEVITISIDMNCKRKHHRYFAFLLISLFVSTSSVSRLSPRRFSMATWRSAGEHLLEFLPFTFYDGPSPTRRLLAVLGVILPKRNIMSEEIFSS